MTTEGPTQTHVSYLRHRAQETRNIEVDRAIEEFITCAYLVVLARRNGTSDELPPALDNLAAALAHMEATALAASQPQPPVDARELPL